MARAYSYDKYMELRSMSLEDKIAWSSQIILKALKDNKTPAVSFSWGKDSVVMLDLVRRFCKNTYVIFANTLCEYPETYTYRDDMLKGYFKGINYVETRPIKNFWSCVKEYGFPKLRQIHNKNNKERVASPKCCLYLKERPMDLKHKELNVDVVFIGLQASESMNRRLLFLRMGPYYKNKVRGVYYCLPLSIWTDKDIYGYIEKKGIPLNPIYNIMARNGCMFCTGFKNWRSVMAKYNSKLYGSISKRFDGQTILRDCEGF